MKRFQRVLSFMMALVMCVGLIPAHGRAALVTTDPMYFTHVNLSAAGAAQISDWVSGAYGTEMQAMEMTYGDQAWQQPEYAKTRLMLRAMSLEPQSYEEPIEYFFPQSDSGSIHELTLYGDRELQPSQITLTGVRLTGNIEKHVYGNGGGETYWYTAPVFVPNTDVTMGIQVDGALFAEIPLTHVDDGCPVSLYSTLWVKDYEENDSGLVTSLKLQVSGITLPRTASSYLLTWSDGNPDVAAESLSEEDQYGYRTVTFLFDGGMSAQTISHADLSFVDHPAYFFGKGDHLVEQDVAGAPKYAFRTDYSFGDRPYWMLGGTVASFLSPYYCIYKAPNTTPLADPEVIPTFTAPAETHAAKIDLTVAPGSYAGGEMAYSTDGGSTWSDWRTADVALDLTLGEYGVYSVALRFRKDGYKTYTLTAQSVDYNDGIPAAPTQGGVLVTATGAEADKRGSVYVLTGEEDAQYTFYADAPSGRTLEAVFRKADDTEVLTQDMAWNAANARYEVTLVRSLLREATKVDLHVKAAGETPAGRTLTLLLKTVEPAAIRAIYAPAVAHEVKDGYCAVAPGAAITGTFETSGGEDTSAQMKLVYITSTEESKTVTVPAAVDGNGQYAALITLPGDTATLSAISYELLEGGAVVGHVDYDVSNYRVWAETRVTGIPADYVGTTLTVKGAGVEKYAVLTAADYADLSLGDLPTGSYVYEFTGASGHIAGGAVSVTRGSNIVLTGLPALGSVTVTTTGFTDSATGMTVNPPAQVTLALTAPDGTPVKLFGATGVTMGEIPVGSTGTVTLNYDSAAYEQIMDCTPASRDITVNGAESAEFTYRPFTYRTISGSVWGNKTYPSGYVSTFVPGGAKVVVTQEITRGGKTEVYTQTATVDARSTTGNRGRWSVRCYDNIPAKVEAKAFTWGTQTRTVTDSGNVNLGQITMTYGDEMLIRLEAKVETPASVKADGSSYYGAADSVQTTVDSSFLQVDYIDAGGKTYYKSSGAYEVETVNGQAYLKIKEGIVVGNEHVGVHAYGSYNYGTMSLSLGAWGQSASVKEDKDGVPVATFTAINYGGELRATVVDDPESGMTGFFVLFHSDTRCTFVRGTGLLRIPYSQAETMGEKAVVALMVRNEDADAMVEVLNSNCKAIYDVLPNGEMQHDTYYRLWDYDRKLPYVKKGLPQNRIMYLENLLPKEIIGTEFLPPYRFTYRFELSDNPGKVWMIGTLEKRFPEQVSKDPLRSLEIFVPQGGDSWTVNEADLTANANFYADGRLIAAPNVWRKDSVTRSSITAEIPLSNGNIAAFSARLKYGGQWDGSNSTLQEFTCIEHVPIFTIVNPGDVYIADQLKAQGLGSKPEEVQAGWKLNLAMRIFSTDDDAENIITLYDNGAQIKRFNVSKGRYVQNDTGSSVILGGSMQKVQVALTDNLQPGVHALWAERTYHGEVIQTEPVVFMLVAGAEHNEVYINELNWTHWNSRIPGSADHMYFENLSDLAGENIWIWPGKRHQMSFKVNNATSAELAGVTLAYRTLEAKAPAIPAGATNAAMANLSSLPVQYDTVTKRIACRLISENRNANYSIWGFENEDLGYLQGFDFEFQYDAAIEKEVTSMTLAEMDQLETESFYRAHDLGEVPDLNAMATEVAGMSDTQLNDAFTQIGEISAELPRQGVKLQVKEHTDTTFRAELEAPTDVVAEYTVTMQDSGTEQLPDVWQLMDTEREFGNQDPDEEGWEVSWAEFDTAQGEVLIRIATFEGTDATGTAAILNHSTYYLPEQVAETLMGDSGASGGSSGMPGGGSGVIPGTSPTLAQLTQNPQSGTNEDHWTKKVYDFTSTAYAVADIGYQGLKDFIWLDAAINTNGRIDPAGEWIGTWGDAKFAKGLDKTFKVLGVADTLITFAKGPSGRDSGSLDALLSMVRDEKARASLERQLKDYEEIRGSVYTQERTMSTISTAVGFIPGAGIVGKIGLFVFNIGNSLITGWTKDYNDQVYNSTLHDIQMQIQLERRRAEVLAKKSYDEAEQWLRDRMDHFYGKGKWSERALQEERKYWVLVRFPNGTLKYVWHEKVPNFDVYLDPSGFVYEAVEENRLEGVTATLYYSETEDGSYSLWTDPTGQQYNPQPTADEGRYSWMVPTGWWKVRYEKDGYLISETRPMRVPPIHTAVNIGLVSTEAPQASVSAADGKITVIFSKYMQLESLIHLYGEGSYDSGAFDSSAFAVRFYDANGVAIPGTVTFPDKAANVGYKGDGYGQDVIDSRWFVRTAVFTPEDPAVDLTGMTKQYVDGIRSYSGVLLDASHEAALYLVTPDANGGELSVSALATGTDGKLSKLPEPTREDYAFDGWFTAPDGGTQVTADTVFTANATIYARWKGTVATPVLTPSGNFTDSKTIAITCATDGAAIYYTTDGSVPTTAGTAYTGAFTVSDTATVRAIAVKDGMTDSAIASADYTFVIAPTGGGSSAPNYLPTVTQTAGGSTGVYPYAPRSNEKVTVTVRPDAGYAVAGVTVKDASGKEIAVTKNADGTYSFIQPDGKVTIEPEFTKEEEEEQQPQPETLAFTDVAQGAYYHDAVTWAVANGVTAGTSATTFSPEASCTRAQMVTFLWNAAGKPEPKEAAEFSDVAGDSYYAKAVAWAKENGITAGTSATTFSPDETVTRAQTVTFLFRALKGVSSGENTFTDVAQSDYYADAVAWAKADGITSGTSATTFSPADDCLRAQIITFLYRAYNKD